MAPQGRLAREWLGSAMSPQAELGSDSGDPEDSSFFLALRDDNCRGTCMIMDHHAMPLTRSWCLFEVYQTCLLTSQHERLAQGRMRRPNTIGGAISKTAGQPWVQRRGKVSAVKVARQRKMRCADGLDDRIK